ncbi:MAG: Stk1 family PASTA domain-containing Ser/Thr kinase [Oscillospiraceae bacterium]|jgi:serine/threonine-protein kinase|nr:Stk1 family PASTA domain-containing Ser/Thr kinase [Oscillospiraceae bacterium]
MDKYIGRLLDNRYEILEVIGTGGMAVVYKARCHRLNRLVAIKILKDEYSQDSDFRRRFHAEAQAVAMLNHPNIVSVFDVSTSGDADYIVMELVEGMTLKQYMEIKGVLTWREALHWSMQIAKALEHAHNSGIVHRDIKPHNVMILKNGSAKVTDFGIARIMSAQNTLTKEALGSVHYISPEQAKGGRVDNRSDLYALGVVMYEMLTGRPPYDGESPVAVALQHISGGAILPSALNANIPDGFEQIILHAMEVDPARRYASATEMLYDLEEFRKNPSIRFYFDMPPAAPRPSAAPKRPAPKNAAERVAGVRPDAPRRDYRSSAEAERIRQNSEKLRRTQPQKPLPEEEEKDTGNKAATIAIFSCAAVAVIAIIIFAVFAFKGGFASTPDLVEVPNFIGQVYAELDSKDYPDFTLVDDIYEFSDEYKDGEIMDQDPDANSSVKPGTKIKFTVSQGPRTDKMSDLTNRSRENAEKYLKGLDMRLSIIVEEEYHDTIEAGRITRTQPEYGEELTTGQEVHIWVSKGPETKMAKCPDVRGMDITKAIEILKSRKLEYDYERVDSDADKNEVVDQSVKPNDEVAEGTVVFLKISNGPVETEPPTEPPTAAPTDPPKTEPEKVKRTETINLPTDRTESYVLSIRLNGEKVYEDVEVDPSESAMPVLLEGDKGKTYTYEIYIDNTLYTTLEVTF